MRSFLPWIVAGLMLGAIVHIVSILMMPALSGQDATTRLRALATLNHLQLLPRVTPERMALPFDDPDLATGICPFDISAMPLRIKVPAGEEFLTVSFLQPGGSIFYALSDHATANGMLDIRLADKAQMTEIEAEDPGDEAVSELRVPAKSLIGVVLIKALANDRAQLANAEARISRATCTTEAIAN